LPAAALCRSRLRYRVADVRAPAGDKNVRDGVRSLRNMSHIGQSILFGVQACIDVQNETMQLFNILLGFLVFVLVGWINFTRGVESPTAMTHVAVTVSWMCTVAMCAIREYTNGLGKWWFIFLLPMTALIPYYVAKVHYYPRSKDLDGTKWAKSTSLVVWWCLLNVAAFLSMLTYMRMHIADIPHILTLLLVCLISHTLDIVDALCVMKIKEPGEAEFHATIATLSSINPFLLFPLFGSLYAIELSVPQSALTVVQAALSLRHD
jgi:hypothetical protein